MTRLRTLLSRIAQDGKADPSAGIAGLCFLACGLIVAFAYLSTLLRVYGPVAREWLISLSIASHDWLGAVQAAWGLA